MRQSGSYYAHDTQPQELVARTRQSELLRQKVADAMKKDAEVSVPSNPLFPPIKLLS